MIAPCPSKIVCPPGDGILGIDFPFANLTSEQPDSDDFIGDNYGFTWFFPPIGSNWTRNSCLGVCTSFISQADADECAAIQNLVCLVGDWNPLPGTVIDGDGSSGPPIIERFSGGPLPMFTNQLAQCTVVCPDGLPFTFQVQAGLFMAPSQLLADRIADSFACTLAFKNLLCLGPLQPQACLDDTYAATIRASRFVPTHWTLVSGSLPPGIVMTPGPLNTLDFDGIPTVTGNYTFVILAQQTGGIFFQKTYVINVLGMTTLTLPDATEGNFYTQQLNVGGNTGAVTFSVQSGSLPGGLTLNGTGLLFGTPTATGDFTFTVLFADTSGLSCVKEFTLHVATAQVCPVFVANLAGGAGVQGVTAAHDTTDARILVWGSKRLFNAQTLGLINIVTVDPNPGAAWVPTLKKFVYAGNVVATRAWNVVDAVTGLTVTVGDKTDLATVPSYAADEDKLYGIGWDNPGTLDAFLTRFNPNTLAVDLKTNVGIPPWSVGQPYYCAAPKCLFVFGHDGSDVLSKRTLPAFGLSGTIDFGVPPYVKAFATGIVFNTVTSTLFVSAVRSADNREICVEVDPTTFTVLRTFVLTDTNIGGALAIDFNPGNGWIYVMGRFTLTVIDAVAHTTFCTVGPITNSFGVGYDQLSKRLWIPNFVTTNIGYYE